MLKWCLKSPLIPFCTVFSALSLFLLAPPLFWVLQWFWEFGFLVDMVATTCSWVNVMICEMEKFYYWSVTLKINIGLPVWPRHFDSYDKTCQSYNVLCKTLASYIRLTFVLVVHEFFHVDGCLQKHAGAGIIKCYKAILIGSRV